MWQVSLDPPLHQVFISCGVSIILEELSTVYAVPSLSDPSFNIVSVLCHSILDVQYIAIASQTLRLESMVVSDIGDEVRDGLEVALLYDTGVVVTTRQGLPPLVRCGSDLIQLSHVGWSAFALVQC